MRINFICNKQGCANKQQRNRWLHCNVSGRCDNIFFFFDFKAFTIYLKKEKKKYGASMPQKTRVPKDCKKSSHWCDHITPLFS